MIKFVIVALLILILYVIWVMPLSKVYIVDSFKENLDLHKLPVVSMYEGSTKLKFVLDTGSTDSYISPSILRYIHYTEGGVESNPIYGYGSVSNVSNKRIFMTLEHNHDMVEGTFLISQEVEESLAAAFPSIIVHGIIGSDFLKSNGYILDYSDFTIKKRR